MKIVAKDTDLDERLQIRTTEETFKKFETLRVKYGCTRRHDWLKWMLDNYIEPVFEREGEMKFI